MPTVTGANRNDQKNLEKAERGKAPSGPTVKFKSAFREHVIFYTIEGRDTLGRVTKPANAVEFDAFNASVPRDNKAALKRLREHDLYGTKLLEEGVHY